MDANNLCQLEIQMMIEKLLVKNYNILIMPFALTQHHLVILYALNQYVLKFKQKAQRIRKSLISVNQ